MRVEPRGELTQIFSEKESQRMRGSLEEVLGRGAKGQPCTQGKEAGSEWETRDLLVGRVEWGSASMGILTHGAPCPM